MAFFCEAGVPSTAIGTYLRVMSVLGVSGELALLAGDTFAFRRRRDPRPPDPPQRRYHRPVRVRHRRKPEWKSRVHRVQSANTNHRVGYCLDVVDLFLSKAVAGREKDRKFCMALLEHGYVKLARVLDLVPSMPIDVNEQRRLRAAISRWARALREAGHDLADS